MCTSASLPRAARMAAGAISGFVLCGATARAQADVLRTWVAPSGTELHEPGYEVYDQTTLAVLPDVDGDGLPEILLGDTAFPAPTGLEGALFVLSGAEPAPGQPATVLRTHYASNLDAFVGRLPLSLGDVDGDGLSDYASGGTVFGGLTGAVLLVGSFTQALGDLDGDGLAEFLEGYRVRAGGSFDVLYSVLTLQAVPLGGDVDGDGVFDFAGFSRGGYYCEGASRFGAVSGADGRILWEEYRPACAGPLGLSGDLNGDGLGDLLVTSWGVTHIRDAATGAVLAEFPRPESEVHAGHGPLFDTPGDLDGDGVGDLLARLFEGDGERTERSLVAIDGRRLRRHWELEGLTTYSIFSAPGIDWNLDGFPDFLRGEEVEEETLPRRVRSLHEPWTIALHSGAPARGGNGSPRSGVRGVGSPCAPTSATPPRIGITGTPWIGETVELHLSGIAPDTRAFLLLGDLGGHVRGGPPCGASVVPREVRSSKASEIAPGRGLATEILAIPPLLDLVGTTLHAQWLCRSLTRPQASTNALELAFGIGPRHPTTVVGRVMLEDGTLLPDATVEVLGQGLVGTSSSGGRFAIPGVAITWDGVRVLVTTDLGGEIWSRIVGPVDAVPGLTTDIGDAVLSQSKKVLVLSPGIGRDPLMDRLREVGVMPEDLLRLGSPPRTLSAFGAIWQVGLDPLPEEVQTRLAEYVEAGGGLLACGVHPALFERVILEGIPASTSLPARYPYCFQQVGPDGISLFPNPLTCLNFHWGAYALLGVPDRNVLLRSADGLTIGAAWFRSDLAGGRGRLLALANSSWSWRQSHNPVEVFDNFHSFLLQDSPTVVAGTVRFPNGSPARRATLQISELALEVESSADGSFVFPDVTSRLPAIEVQAFARLKETLHRGAETVPPVPGHVVQADIVLRHGVDVLVFGDAAALRAVMVEELASILPATSRVDHAPNLPADLGPYQTIWHVGRSVSLSRAQQARLASFVHSGGGLHLSAETRGSDVRVAQSVVGVLGQLLPDASWVVDPADSPGPHRFEAQARRSITRVPNRLSEWLPGGAASLLGLPARNVLVRDGTGAPCGGYWDGQDLSGGGGRVTLLMDSYWIDQPQSRRGVIENLQLFLSPAAGALLR